MEGEHLFQQPPHHPTALGKYLHPQQHPEIQSLGSESVPPYPGPIEHPFLGQPIVSRDQGD
jgi:hypothetical protein